MERTFVHTWKKLHKDLLQELHQQVSSLLLIISKLEPLLNVLNLSINLKDITGKQHT